MICLVILSPSYVEWLGELSCNVLFEDKHSAARAFHALSQELPSPPPTIESADYSKDDANMDETKEDEPAYIDESNDRWAKVDETNDDEGLKDRRSKVDETNADDNEGDADDAEKNSMDATTATTTNIEDTTKQQQEEKEPLPDYGGLGWRFCKWTVRKVRPNSVNYYIPTSLCVIPSTKTGHSL